MADQNNNLSDSHLRTEIQQVRNILLSNYPILKKFYVDKAASLVKQFASMMEAIHAAAAIQNKDQTPAGSPDQRLWWDCHHAEELAICLTTMEDPKNLHITKDNFNKALELFYFKARSSHNFHTYSDCCRAVIKSLVDQGAIEQAAEAIERVITSPLFSGSLGVKEEIKPTLEAELEKLHPAKV